MHGFESPVSNVPAFLVKLWRLVEDPSTDDLISWSERGDSFIIKDQATFAKELLPQYFKHNNMASFIRQLNMYGFRKLVNFEKSGLKVENHDMEFHNPCFLKGKVRLLDCIKRKVSVQSSISSTKVTPESARTNPKDILTDLTSIREKQESMNNLLVGMKKENELLWRELSALRKKHKTQEQIIQKVIQFLVSIVQSGKPNIGMKRQMARMLQDNKSQNNKKGNISRQLDVVRGKKQDIIFTSVQDKLTSPVGPVIHEVTDLDHEEASNYSTYDESAASVNGSSRYLDTTEDDSASSPASESLGQLSLFTPRTPLLLSSPDIESDQVLGLTAADGESEQVLGLPVDFIPSDDIPVPDIASVVSISNNGEDSESDDQDNVVMFPDSANNDAVVEDVGNVISIPEDGSVISLPDEISHAVNLASSDISNVISIPEHSNAISLLQNKSRELCLPNTAANVASFSGTIDNAISIPEVTCSSNSDLNLTSDIIPFSPSFASLFSPQNNSTVKDTLSADTVYRNINSPAGSVSVSAAKSAVTVSPAASNSSSTTLCSIKKDPFLNSKPEDCAIKSNELQLAVSEIPSASCTENIIAKDAFSNHIIETDEEIDTLLEQLKSNSLNIDCSMLLGLFSSDDAAHNTALASQLTSDNGVLKDADTNIMGNELVQYTPSFDTSFDYGFLDSLGSEVLDTGRSGENEDLNSSTHEKHDKILANIKKEKTDEQCCLGRDTSISSPVPCKKPKLTRVKGKRKGK